MKLSYSSNAYRKWTATDAIERIATLGYCGMELMADVPHAWPATTTDEQVDAMRRLVEQHGLTLSNVNAFMTTAVGDFWHPSWIESDADFRRLRIRHTIDALTMARKLGARCISTEPGGPAGARFQSRTSGAREAALDTFVAGLTEVLCHAQDEGVLLLVEPEPGLLIENADQFLELAERMESPMFGLNFDISHFYCVNEPLPETVERLKMFTRHYHIADIAAPRIHEHLIPGRGAIDFASVLGAIQGTGYDGWITVELYPYLDDPDGAGREARDYLTRLMPVNSGCPILSEGKGGGPIRPESVSPPPLLRKDGAPIANDER